VPRLAQRRVILFFWPRRASSPNQTHMGGVLSSAIHGVMAATFLRIRGSSPFSMRQRRPHLLTSGRPQAACTMIPHSRGHRAQERVGPIFLRRRVSAPSGSDRHLAWIRRICPITDPRMDDPSSAHALSSAPSGTTPCVTYRQSATSSLRATATIVIRLILPRLLPILS
jgi:hypothetical protein